MLDTFSSDSLKGKLCLLGFIAPIIAIIIHVNAVDGLTGWRLCLNLLCYIWFLIALFRGLASTRCPNCFSANNSKTGKREVERFEGKKIKKIQVGTHMLPLGKTYDFYDVPATIVKTAFSFRCHNCQSSWKITRDIIVDKNDS